MPRTAIPLLALLLAAPWTGSAERGSGVTLTGVRLWPTRQATRIAIDVSGDFEYRYDRLHDPERVYFDILDCTPSIRGRRAYHREVEGNPLVQGIRVAETQPGVTRIVLDLNGLVDYTAHRMINPERLIIELRRGSPPPVTSAVQIDPPVLADLRPAADSPDPLPVRELPRPEPPPAKSPPPAPAARPAAAAASPPRNTERAADPAPPSGSKPVSEVAERGKAARHTSNGGSSLTRALGLKINRVVIDAGHGGHDTGTEGRRGLLEKDLVLDIAKRLGKLVEERMGAEVIYTRTDDTFIPLQTRTGIANDKKADLFISIHANSSRYSRIAGVETYYLNFTTSQDALDVAARENASSQKSVFELRDLIQKITLADKVEESRELATRIQTSLYAFENRYYRGTRNRGVKKAPFVVLIGANMPSVLAEIGFLSNPREEALLKRPQHRQKLAEALYQGISRYAGELSHFQMARNKE